MPASLRIMVKVEVKEIQLKEHPFLHMQHTTGLAIDPGVAPAETAAGRAKCKCNINMQAVRGTRRSRYMRQC
jgi:hypothetical protein